MGYTRSFFWSGLLWNCWNNRRTWRSWWNWRRCNWSTPTPSYTRTKASCRWNRTNPSFWNGNRTNFWDWNRIKLRITNNPWARRFAEHWKQRKLFFRVINSFNRCFNQMRLWVGNRNRWLASNNCFNRTWLRNSNRRLTRDNGVGTRCQPFTKTFLKSFSFFLNARNDPVIDQKLNKQSWLQQIGLLSSFLSTPSRTPINI